MGDLAYPCPIGLRVMNLCWLDFTSEGSLWGISHAFSVKKLPNALVDVA